MDYNLELKINDADQWEVVVKTDTSLLYRFTETPVAKGYTIFLSYRNELIVLFCTKPLRLEVRDWLSKALRKMLAGVGVVCHGLLTMATWITPHPNEVNKNHTKIFLMSIDRLAKSIKVSRLVSVGEPDPTKYQTHPPKMTEAMEHLRCTRLINLIRDQLTITQSK